MRFASVALAALAAFATSALSASPAAAVGGCPSGKACLYSGKNFTSLRVTTASTNACYWLSDYGFTPGGVGVRSWVNNLPVKITLWYTADLNNWHQTTAMGAGAFSSDTSVSSDPYWYSNSDKFCMGSAKP
ncbi:peptidase inhibitor family I36 protein [Streptomyces sp. CB02130]|uniref:peptidase inhibitor family I36 protein n=1 Tax=Streptomyces sp. CB02130 TaxID=1703934 RepID=UPI00093CB693|nr:peptidase inhibitor family I36 protein [Streptomyces sp. CB02130]